MGRERERNRESQRWREREKKRWLKKESKRAWGLFNVYANFCFFTSKIYDTFRQKIFHNRSTNSAAFSALH